MHALRIALVALMLMSFAFVDAHAEGAPTIEWSLVRSIEHDAMHFTQGLEIGNGQLYESAGEYGFSALYVEDLHSGAVLSKHELPDAWFAEGLTIWNDSIVMLTWREGIAQLFDRSLQPTRQFQYHGEGWGLAHDEKHLIMSDGSATITFRKPDDFSVVRRIIVRDNGHLVPRLNELEYVNGYLLANVWFSNRVAVIDPNDGTVIAWLDLTALTQMISLPATPEAGDYVLNGIAYDPVTGHLYVTGKCWPLLFELNWPDTLEHLLSPHRVR